MAEFEKFRKRSVPSPDVAYVTIQRSGAISLNRAAWTLIEKPEQVTLHFDRDDKVIGIEPVPRGLLDHDAFPVRPVGGSRERAGSFVISGKGFTKYYGIPTEPVTRRLGFLVDDDDNGGMVPLLYVWLNEEDIPRGLLS